MASGRSTVPGRACASSSGSPEPLLVGVHRSRFRVLRGVVDRGLPLHAGSGSALRGRLPRGQLQHVPDAGCCSCRGTGRTRQVAGLDGRGPLLFRASRVVRDGTARKAPLIASVRCTPSGPGRRALAVVARQRYRADERLRKLEDRAVLSAVQVGRSGSRRTAGRWRSATSWAGWSWRRGRTMSCA